MHRLAFALACTLGCRAEQQGPGTPPPEPVPTQHPRTDDAPPAPSLRPTPPHGVPMPRGVTSIAISDGGTTAAYYWKGVFAGDARDPLIVARTLEAKSHGEELTANQAAFALYREDVVAAGWDVETYEEYRFSYLVRRPSGALAVFVSMAWPNADGQIPPLSPPLANDVLEYFEVSIGPPGG